MDRYLAYRPWRAARRHVLDGRLDRIGEVAVEFRPEQPGPERPRTRRFLHRAGHASPG